jgi:2-oxo-4-hydroxy-4-carboxy-5-ureidoimidazoline decarboxylase
LNLASFNAAPADAAVATMLSCCGSRRFAAAMAAGRPYDSLAAAERAVHVVFESLTWDDILEAVDAHPRIGARVSGQSAREQSGVAEESRAALTAGNLEYEERFGHVFLICATGLSGAQMLDALRQRLKNDKSSETLVVTAELLAITILRVDEALGQ